MAGEEDLRGVALDRQADRASMRPRLGGRGRALVPSIGRRGPYYCFNEAPGSVAGEESVDIDLHRVVVRPASMRPRLGGRGRASGPRARRQPKPRRFNEAPARWPGKSRPWTWKEPAKSDWIALQ